MSLEAKRIIVALLSFLFLGSLLIVAWVEGGKQRIAPELDLSISVENQSCVNCHREESPAIVSQWEYSRHADLGVGCLECHTAEDDDIDAYEHEGEVIATIVTPNDCARCHQAIADEFQQSHHASAGNILGSLDNVLGEIIEGMPAAVNGCMQCHGSEVAFQRDSEGEIKRTERGIPLMDPDTWPNTGIGRKNLDGSLGTCSACHSRHAFDTKVARFPDNCGKCHMGPDHPQIEIYNESKHGIAFRAQIEDMALDSETWVVGEDYTAAPTCATCHMSATRDLPITHDVGKRLTWTLRPPISTRMEDWQEKKADMQNVCSACHSMGFTENWYKQYDSAIDLYNRKFAEPGVKIMAALKEAGAITPDPFDEHIEWVWFEVWHHEGRRARHGASMQGPDFTQWHGFYEVAKHFYFKLIPEARELAHGHPEAEKAIEEALSGPDHAWLEGMDEETKAKVRSFYKERYDQDQ
ncbi:MAG: multiheme c-type cytochrome [Planctomycetota bacterium]|jgi:hypothetical protein